jgi:hypothetical protein
MLKFARLLQLVDEITRRPQVPGRRPIRRATLAVQELEDRVVPTLLGQHLFPADNAWNQNISNAPVDPNSATMIASIGTSTRVTPDWGANPNNLFTQTRMYGIPVNIVHGNSANVTKTTVIIDNYPGESDQIQVPLPNTYQPVIEGDLPNGPNTNGPGGNSGQRGDSHLIVWDEDNNVAYELYGAARPTDPNLFPNTNGVELAHTDGLWHAAQETVWNMKTDTFRTLGATSADAAGLSILAGLARPDEGLPVSQGGTGVIDHALRVTLNGNQIASTAFTYPASHMVTGQNGPIPLGARLRLMNTPTINQLISLMGPQSQILAHAMQQYGLIVADVGSPMYVTGTDVFVDNVDPGVGNLTWNEQDILASLTSHSAGLEALNAGDFQVVDLAPIVTGLSASMGTAGTTLTVTGQNFSGAAGRLSVLFGSTPGTSVNVIDDAHLTVVVPAGSGTVNVQVQSGIVEVDQLDLPSHPNLTETIASGYQTSNLFGYGTSAITSADKFTFGAPISGTSSTDNFASASVASGSTDTLTIVVKDTNGNAVTGLTSSAFGLTLSGGSAGTFSAVTATATAGTYTATFTGTTAGMASTLTITVNGVTLTTHPTVTVTPGPVSATVSTAGFAAANVAPGLTDALTIVVKDAAGNAITGLASSAFGLALSVGTSAGTFSAVTAAATPGTYTATFTATTAGTTSTLAVTVNSVSLATRPTIAVNTNPPTATVGPVAPNTLTSALGSLSITFSRAVTDFVLTSLQLQRNGTAVALTGATLTTSDQVTWTLGGLAGMTGTPGRYTLTLVAAGSGIQDLSGNVLTANATATWHLARTGAPPSWLPAVASLLAHSAEYYTAFVTAAYQHFLGRGASTAEAATWVTFMQNGMSDAQLEADLVGSAEYVAAHGGGATWVRGMYQDLLGRTPAQSEINGWLQVLAGGATPTQVAYDIASSLERQALRVTADYTLYLGRSPSAAEVGGWINSGLSNESIIATFLDSVEYFQDHSGNASDWYAAAFQNLFGHAATLPGTIPSYTNAVAATFTHSVEYDTAFVTAAYQHFLGRGASGAELAGWATAMQNGLTDAQVEANLVGSAEYIAAHGGLGAGWVHGLFQDLLGRTPAQSEINGWLQALVAGATPVQVAYNIAASPERAAQRVIADYTTVLGRSPAPAELNSWVQVLASGASNENVLANLVGSYECYLRNHGDPQDWWDQAIQQLMGPGGF